MLWLAGDVKERTHLSKRVGHEVPGGVSLAFVVKVRVGGGGGMLRDINYHKATLQSEGKQYSLEGTIFVLSIKHREWLFWKFIIHDCCEAGVPHV